jgi:hypothetical protein
MTRFKKSSIYEKLNTKHEEAFVKKLAWKKATSSWKSRKQHPDDIMEAESRAKKFFRNFISLRKKERALREKARLKGSPKRAKGSPKRAKGSPKRAKGSPKRAKGSPKRAK